MRSSPFEGALCYLGKTHKLQVEIKQLPDGPMDTHIFAVTWRERSPEEAAAPYKNVVIDLAKKKVSGSPTSARTSPKRPQLAPLSLSTGNGTPQKLPALNNVKPLQWVCNCLLLTCFKTFSVCNHKRVSS